MSNRHKTAEQLQRGDKFSMAATLVEVMSTYDLDDDDYIKLGCRLISIPGPRICTLTVPRNMLFFLH